MTKNDDAQENLFTEGFVGAESIETYTKRYETWLANKRDSNANGRFVEYDDGGLHCFEYGNTNNIGHSSDYSIIKIRNGINVFIFSNNKGIPYGHETFLIRGKTNFNKNGNKDDQKVKKRTKYIFWKKPLFWNYKILFL